jgi:hypothetical protein
LYGCETCSYITRSSYSCVAGFENRALRRIFGTKKEEVAGGWRKLHNDELHDSYTSRNIIRVIKSRRKFWAGHVVHMEIREVPSKYFFGKRERKRTLGRRKCRREYNNNRLKC